MIRNESLERRHLCRRVGFTWSASILAGAPHCPQGISQWLAIRPRGTVRIEMEIDPNSMPPKGQPSTLPSVTQISVLVPSHPSVSLPKAPDRRRFLHQFCTSFAPLCGDLERGSTSHHPSTLKIFILGNQK
jgi:hypothetical protein